VLLKASTLAAMSLQEFAALLAYSTALAFTPGPNTALGMLRA